MSDLDTGVLESPLLEELQRKAFAPDLITPLKQAVRDGAQVVLTFQA